MDPGGGLSITDAPVVGVGVGVGVGVAVGLAVGVGVGVGAGVCGGWKAIAATLLAAKVVRTPLGVILRMLPARVRCSQRASATNRLSALSIARPFG